ncbi:MAG: HlyD family efflux transporter periplasmic adaptor subunit [Ectothiorhodospiraceae bacterium]|jgi:multidrug efflux pump subunit AcrA (membrane-fusion protein)|nr:HlyD family efflux transporter periplasmic adaptor subunit [Ectothiorhodospiraceae bacterium]
MKLKSILRPLVPLVILALGIAGFMLLVATKPKQPPAGAGERVWRVEAQEILPATLTPTLTLYGQLTSPRASTLRAAVAAEVAEVPAQEGAFVRKGELLVRLDDGDIRLQLAQREAEARELESQIEAEHLRHRNDLAALAHEKTLLELAARSVERFRNLRDQQLGSQAQHDDAQQAYERQQLAVRSRELAIAEHATRLAQIEARLERTRALLAQARLDLARTRITAPFDARVSRRLTAPGDRMKVGDAVLELFDTGRLEVRASIPAAYLPDVRRILAVDGGLRATGEADGDTVQLSLLRLAGETPDASGGVLGLFEVTQGGSTLPLGRFVSVRLQLPAEDGLVALPFEALYGTDRIYRLQDERMHGLTIRRAGEWVDDQGRSWILVQHPELRPGDRIVVTRLPNAVDGLKVSVDGDDGA